MKKSAVFDVLIVYTDGVATSASSVKLTDKMPFSKSSKRLSYNDSYAYFLKICKKNNLKAAFTTTKDITKDGHFSAHWTYARNKWIKVNAPCYASLIFDKFFPINNKQKVRRASLFSNVGIKPFNPHEILSLFFDKQKTYDLLNKFAIPTVTIKSNSLKSINSAVLKLQSLVDVHPKKNDFSRKIIIKDRFGAGGNNIFCTQLKKRKMHIQEVMNNNRGVSFILQPFANFEEGNGFKSNPGFTDIRVIYLGNKIIQAYVRTAAKDDFRCNAHQGGNVRYISKREIPLKIRLMAKEILNVLNEDNCVFALDFIISDNGNAYLMEGNSGPGLNWSLSHDKDEKNTKKFIREIIKEIVLRVNILKPVDHPILNISVPIGVTIPIINV